MSTNGDYIKSTPTNYIKYDNIKTINLTSIKCGDMKYSNPYEYKL
jgi:hypothetical protein